MKTDRPLLQKKRCWTQEFVNALVPAWVALSWEYNLLMASDLFPDCVYYESCQWFAAEFEMGHLLWNLLSLNIWEHSCELTFTVCRMCCSAPALRCIVLVACRILFRDAQSRFLGCPMDFMVWCMMHDCFPIAMNTCPKICSPICSAGF